MAEILGETETLVLSVKIKDASIHPGHYNWYNIILLYSLQKYFVRKAITGVNCYGHAMRKTKGYFSILNAKL